MGAVSMDGATTGMAFMAGPVFGTLTAVANSVATEISEPSMAVTSVVAASAAKAGSTAEVDFMAAVATVAGTAKVPIP